MIRHIVFFTVRDGQNPEAVGRGLAMLTAVPHGRTEVGRNRSLDTLSDHVDFVVHGEFADEAELAAYKAHPIYEEATRAVRPLREMRLAADFESAW